MLSNFLKKDTLKSGHPRNLDSYPVSQNDFSSRVVTRQPKIDRRLHRTFRNSPINRGKRLATDHMILQPLLYPQAAQVRKEERKKAEKEKLLQETDPDKTRKWEVQN